MNVEIDPARTPRAAAIRIAAAFAVALAFALGCYLLLEAARPQEGVISFSFLLILPAALSAFVAYVADPWAERPLRAYLLVPVTMLVVVIIASAAILREGVICILMLAPLWLVSGLAGAGLMYKLRRRRTTGGAGGRLNSAVFLAVPLLAIQVEPYIPVPIADVVVTRSIVVHATPERLWPLLRGIPDVRPGEGQWNISQDVIGVPRPLGARLIGTGVGAERLADWGDHVRFRERIIEWVPGSRIVWRFRFDDFAGWAMTDRHLMPDTPHFRVTTGGYRLAPLAPGRTRVTLDTHYRVRTPVNGYSRLWGELLLGDVEENLLALVKHRAERPRPLPA